MGKDADSAAGLNWENPSVRDTNSLQGLTIRDGQSILFRDSRECSAGSRTAGAGGAEQESGGRSRGGGRGFQLYTAEEQEQREKEKECFAVKSGAKN